MSSDLVFDIIAREKTRPAFDAANNNAREFARNINEAGKAASKSMDAARGSVANLAAQFQDIAVQLQGGASPLTVALQQGTQIGAALGPLGASGAVRALGGAFTSLLSPVNLITIGAIAAGGALYTYFQNLGEGSKAAQELLQNQNELILAVAEAWGDALPELQAYVEGLRQAKEQADLLSATDIMADRQFDTARKAAEALNVQMANVVQQMNGAGADPSAIMSLQEAWNGVSDSLAKGTASERELGQVHDALTAAIDQTGIPALQEFATEFDSLAERIVNATNKAAVFRQQTMAALTSNSWAVPGMLSPLFSENGKITNGDNFMPPGETPAPTKRPNIEMEGMPWLPKEGNRGLSELEKQEKAYKKVTQSLQDELMMVGKSTADQRTLEMQRRAGVEATSDQGKSIAALVQQIESEREAIERGKKQHEDFQKSVETAFSAADKTILSIVDGSEKASTALAKLAINFAFAAAQAALFNSGPLAGLFNGFGGSSSSGFSANTTLSSFLGYRANGGAVEPWGTYVVGERGPELLKMGGGRGSVVSNESAFGRSPIVFNVNTPDADSFVKSRSQVETMMARAVSRGQRGM